MNKVRVEPIAEKPAQRASQPDVRIITKKQKTVNEAPTKQKTVNEAPTPKHKEPLKGAVIKREAITKQKSVVRKRTVVR